MAGRQANLAWQTLIDLSPARPGRPGPPHMRLAAAAIDGAIAALAEVIRGFLLALGSRARGPAAA